MKKPDIKRLEISILLGLVISVILSTVTFAEDCDNIRNSVLRMHVIANSDTEEDQNLKYKVRDAVLAAGKEYFDGSIDCSQAEKILIPHKDELEDIAESVVRENGFDYEVNIEIGKDYFNTRTYENSVTLPAGEYEAVRVIIGEGKGRNWWCVMFPPMCLPAAESDTKIEDVLNDNEVEIVKSNPKYEPRFKIIELIARINENLK